MAERSDIEQIRERIDLTELVGTKVTLKRSGKSWKGLCPFHSEKNPSFHVYPESGTYICFTCGEKGDAFSWMMKQEGLDFPEALEQLAARTGVTLQRGVPRDPHRDETRERIYALNAEAATFFTNVLLNMPAGEVGRRYVAERGLTRETVERFALGVAPDAWDALLKHLTGRGHSEAAIVEAGLARARENSDGAYDVFRNRLLFPIRNRDGQIVGFGGRTLGGDRAKYLNTPQTAVFDKSAVLYGIDLAKDAIRKTDTAVIVEGYVDAIMAHQVGYPNVVASMGTALTEAQAKVLKRLTKRIILALDADLAGQSAMQRGQETMRNSAEHKVVATAEAIYQASRQPYSYEQISKMLPFESKLETELLVLTIPEGKDPDEFLRARPNDWPELVRRAVPLVDFMIRAVIGSTNLDDPREKSAAVAQLAPLIRELPDQIQQHHYAAQIARLLDLDSDVVLSEIRRLSLTRKGRHTAPVAEPEPERPAARPLSHERYLLGLLLAYPDAAHEVVDEVLAEDFTDTTERLLWEAIRPLVSADPRLRSAALIAAIANEDLRTIAEQVLAARDGRPEGIPGPIRREIRDTLREVRREAHDLRFRQLQAAIAEANFAGDRETLGVLTGQLVTLLAARRAFDPPPSPYFHDTRTVVEKR